MHTHECVLVHVFAHQCTYASMCVCVVCVCLQLLCVPILPVYIWLWLFFPLCERTGGDAHAVVDTMLCVGCVCLAERVGQHSLELPVHGGSLCLWGVCLCSCVCLWMCLWCGDGGDNSQRHS